MANQVNGSELGWDGVIENDGSEFILLPEGDYDFEVVDFERARHAGSDKLPPCNKAVVQLKIDAPEGTAFIKNNLFLHTQTEGLLCAFFTAIGQRKKGERVTMNWNAVKGSRGRCKLGIRTWTSKSGEEMQSNEVKRFLEPEEGDLPKAGFQAGRF